MTLAETEEAREASASAAPEKTPFISAVVECRVVNQKMGGKKVENEGRGSNERELVNQELGVRV